MTASVSSLVDQVRRAVGMAALTAWISASLEGGASADVLTDAGHRVGLRRVRDTQACQPLMLATSELRGEAFTVARLVLPAPGDVLGLTGPASLNRRALDEGAAIILTENVELPLRARVLLPSDDGEWPLYEVPLPPAVPACWPSLRQARGEFAAGVAGHSDALAALDVASDPNGLRDLVLDEDEQPLPPLPPNISDERQDLLARARLVALLAATAATDDGAAASAAEASSRSAHLRALAAIARRAIAASVSGP